MAGLDNLIAALAGGLGAGTSYLQNKQEIEREQAERERLAKERAAQLALQQSNLKLNQDQFDYGRTRDTVSSAPVDTDLSANPTLMADIERFGIPTVKKETFQPGPKIGATSLPSTASFTLPDIPAGSPLPDSPPSLVPAEGGLTSPADSFGLGSVGKNIYSVHRPETPQERAQRTARETQLGMLKSMREDPRIAEGPGRYIIDAQIRSLEAGGNPTISESELLAMMRAGEPQSPSEGAVSWSDLASAALGRRVSPAERGTLSPDDLRKVDAYEKSQRGTVPQPQRGSEPLSEEYLNAVRNNPRLMLTMTPTERTRVQRELIQSGFSQLGTELNPSELAPVQERQAAIVELSKLKQTLKGAVEKLGPISGWSKLNPYDATARDTLAAIDLARQRVGKALEGGVLRKEDEEKYKKILAVMTDLPEVAYGKIDGLVETLQNDQDVFRRVYELAGYRVPDFSTVAPDVIGGSADDASEAGYERIIGPDGTVRYVKKGR